MEKRSRNLMKIEVCVYFPSENQLLAIAVKTNAKAYINIYWSCPIILGFSIFAKYGLYISLVLT